MVSAADIGAGLIRQLTVSELLEGIMARVARKGTFAVVDRSDEDCLNARDVCQGEVIPI